MLVSLSGIAAYLLLWAATASGVVMSSDRWRRPGRPRALRGAWFGAPAHESLSLAGLGVTLLHAAQSVLAPPSPRLGLLVFSGLDPADGWGLYIGVAAAYLTAAVTASFYVRGRLGRWWRAVHAAAYAAYAAALWHALAIGANAWLPAVRGLYFVTLAILAALSAVRAADLLRRSRSRDDRESLWQRAAAAVGRFRSGRSDVSARHGDYAAEAYGDPHERLR